MKEIVFKVEDVSKLKFTSSNNPGYLMRFGRSATIFGVPFVDLNDPLIHEIVIDIKFKNNID